MQGLFAIVVAMLAFIVPLAIPLFAQSWRSFAIVLAIGLCCIGWLTVDMNTPGSPAQAVGSFIGGLILVGFSSGAIAKLAMLIGRRPLGR